MNDTSAVAIRCPSCRASMKSEALERHDHSVVNVGLCLACAGIWFDRHASVELAPTAVLSLFKEIHAHSDVARQALAGRLACPRCDRDLTLTHDLSKAGQFTYYRCPKSDGRFTPFFQFLREKQFVRSLTPQEIQQVRAEIRQVNCSQCGAPVDLEHGTQCQYCHAPIAVLDADAVEKAVRLWSQPRAPQPPTGAAGAVAQTASPIEHMNTLHALSPLLGVRGAVEWNATLSRGTHGSAGLDLVGVALSALLGSLFDPRD